jgi:hypothetical protein
MRLAGALNSDNTPGKNAIINGCMRLAQRGASFTIGQSATGYTLDRWFQGNGHDAGNMTITQDSTVPNNNFQYSLKMTNAAGNDTSIGAAQYCALWQKVEGYNIVSLRSGKISISFWVRSSKTGTYCVALRNSGQDRAYISEYVVNAANTWEYKQIAIDLSAGVASGTWNYTNSIGLDVLFMLVCGSNYQATKDAWQNGNYFATSSQVNWLNETNTFYITGVQLEPGTIATGFENRDIGKELQLCQRYYRCWESAASNILGIDGFYASGSGQGFYFTLPLNPTMRAAPVPSILFNDTNCTITVYGYADSVRIGMATTTSGRAYAGTGTGGYLRLEAEL